MVNYSQMHNIVNKAKAWFSMVTTVTFGLRDTKQMRQRAYLAKCIYQEKKYLQFLSFHSSFQYNIQTLQRFKS